MVRSREQRPVHVLARDVLDRRVARLADAWATEWQSDTCAVRDPRTLPQLVAIDDCARNARHVVEDAALDKRVYARVAEQD